VSFKRRGGRNQRLERAKNASQRARRLGVGGSGVASERTLPDAGGSGALGSIVRGSATAHFLG
jgi:hypothetical protein